MFKKHYAYVLGYRANMRAESSGFEKLGVVWPRRNQIKKCFSIGRSLFGRSVCAAIEFKLQSKNRLERFATTLRHEHTAGRMLDPTYLSELKAEKEKEDTCAVIDEAT